ncbi:MAG: c-type cytochrome [Myxococcales bacterium]
MKVVPALALCAVAACGGTTSVPAAQIGAERFSDTHLSRSPLNFFSCSTCHVVQATPSTRIDPGYNLYDTVHRGSWWGGDKTRLLDAINTCLGEFMGGGPLQPTDDSARELFEYLSANSPTNPAPPLPLTVIRNVTDLANLGAGSDKNRGKDVYDRSCRTCHGDPHTGNGRLNSKVSIIPEDTISVFPTQARAVVVEKIRHGKFFNIGGVMPLYPAESITDQEIADIVAYIGL